MNKYQEALDKVKSVPLFIEPKPDRNGWTIYLEVSSIEEKNKTDIDVLQELVDKATPKKPIKKTYEYESMYEEILIKTYYICGCEKFSDVHRVDRFCPKCGQAIDWSEDE